MARERKSSKPVEGGNWLDTYADMVTLLLTFFVMLYSSSKIEEDKWQLLLQAFESFGTHVNEVVADPSASAGDDPAVPTAPDPPPDGTPQTIDQLYQYLSAYIAENNLSDSVELERGAANVYLRFRDNVFFDGDSDVLLDEGKTILSGLGTGLRDVDDLIQLIRINGHTADAPMSSVNDRMLSAGRANAVLLYLEQQNVVKPEKLIASAYGKWRPVAPNDTEEDMRLNRRVEIVIMRRDVDYSDPAVLYDLLELEIGDDFTDKDTFIQDITVEETSSEPAAPAAPS